MSYYNELVKEIALREGITIFGITKVDFNQPGFKNLNFGISIGYRLSKSVLDTLTDGPNQIYYFHYQRVNILLDIVALKIADIIQKNGYSALPVPASQIVEWSVPGGKGLISHKSIAISAGIGWLGKNNLVVNEEYGAQFRLATILTDMPFEINSHIMMCKCGECRQCIVVCPAGAIGNTPEEFQLDLCIKKLTEFKKQRNLGQMICGLCQKVCPGRS